MDIPVWLWTSFHIHSFCYLLYFKHGMGSHSSPRALLSYFNLVTCIPSTIFFCLGVDYHFFWRNALVTCCCTTDAPLCCLPRTTACWTPPMLTTRANLPDCLPLPCRAYARHLVHRTHVRASGYVYFPWPAVPLSCHLLPLLSRIASAPPCSRCFLHPCALPGSVYDAVLLSFHYRRAFLPPTAPTGWIWTNTPMRHKLGATILYHLQYGFHPARCRRRPVATFVQR